MAKLPFPPFRPEVLADLAEQAGKLLPGEKSREEMQRSVQLILQNALGRLDLVTREEFDAQTAVLQKTRKRVEELEKELNQLVEEQSKE